MIHGMPFAREAHVLSQADTDEIHGKWHKTFVTVFTLGKSHHSDGFLRTVV